MDRNRDLLIPIGLRTFTKGMAPMDKGHVEALASKHAALEAKINQEAHRPYPNDVLLHQLKKQKLRLKDALVGH